jgi:hypothetical protein
MQENDHLESQELLANMNEDHFDNIDIINYANMSIEENSDKKKLSFMSKLKQGFSDYSSKVNWIVFASICIFTLGSWLDICGNS